MYVQCVYCSTVYTIGTVSKGYLVQQARLYCTSIPRVLYNARCTVLARNPGSDALIRCKNLNSFLFPRHHSPYVVCLVKTQIREPFHADVVCQHPRYPNCTRFLKHTHALQGNNIFPPLRLPGSSRNDRRQNRH